MKHRTRLIFFLACIVAGLLSAGAASAQSEGGLASASSPGVVKEAVQKSIQEAGRLLTDIEKRQSAADAETKASLQKEHEQLKAALAELKHPEDSEPGYLGMRGAPMGGSIIYLWGFLWAIWVGWIFSTVGAFGGIMAGVGHITIFGLGDYARSFGKGMPINKLLTDSTRVSNQWLVGMAALISAFNYYKLGRLVLPLGVCLGIGSVAASGLQNDPTGPAKSAGRQEGRS
jgi:hypothetical protein